MSVKADMVRNLVVPLARGITVSGTRIYTQINTKFNNRFLWLHGLRCAWSLAH
jgi:hypothetical protein